MWAPAFRQAIRAASPALATLGAFVVWDSLGGKDSAIRCEEHSFEGAVRKHPVGVGHFPKHHVPNPRLWVHDALSGDGSLFKGAVGVEASKALHQMSNMLIFSGSSNPSLAEEIAYELHKPLGKISLGRYADGETTVQVLENVRGKDVFIVQSTCQPVHENLMELLLMISTMRRASARTITAVIPYYGYKRDVGTAPSFVTMIRSDVPADSMDTEATAGRRAELSINDKPGGLHLPASSSSVLSDSPARLLPAQDFSFPVSAADVAKMLEAMGVDRIIAVELQPPGNGQIEGFFTSAVPVENVRATALAVEHFRKLKLNNVVVVSPNETCIPLAQDFRSGLQKTTGKPVGFATIIEAGRSRGADRYVHNMRSSSEEATLDVVGDVAGRDVIIVDDMIDTGFTLMRRLQKLKEKGAGRMIAFATHGLFNGSALSRITKSPLSEVIVTNTVPLRDDIDTRHTHKIAQLSIAPLLAEAVLRVQTGQSLQSLRVFDRENADTRYSGQE